MMNVSRVSGQHANVWEHLLVKDDTVLQADFIGACNSHQIGRHENYEAFKCIVKGLLLPENAYCLNIAPEWSKAGNIRMEKILRNKCVI